MMTCRYCHIDHFGRSNRGIATLHLFPVFPIMSFVLVRVQLLLL
jgi:hypothetical protein